MNSELLLMIRFKILLLLFLISCPMFSQSGFVIERERKNFKLKFEQVNNLIVVPVELNGVKLSFVLDTGVNTTLVFTAAQDSLRMMNASKIFFKGMGAEKPMPAIRSEGNTLKIGKALNRDFTFFTVNEWELDLSYRMGVPIHGIIGYDFFKDFIVEIRYLRKKLVIHDPERYRYRNCRRCEDFQLSMHKNKPYIRLLVSIEDKIPVYLNLLIDSGSSEAIWLFENKEKNIILPEKHFRDFLGYGFGGSIYGARSRIRELRLGKYKLKDVTTGFPDTTFTKGLNTHKARDGSLGSQVLNRFRVILDYQGRQIRLRPNRNFGNSFDYDMSGISVAHAGNRLVKEWKPPARKFDEEGTNVLETRMEFTFYLKPEYMIVEIRPGSPAQRAGLKVGDILKTINGRSAYRFDLEDIIELFSSKAGKKIRLEVESEGQEKEVAFRLEKIL